MLPFSSNRPVVLAVLLGLSACSVLTSEQVEAVKAFAKATDNYGQLPGEVIRGYNDVVGLRQALLAGRAETREDAEASLSTAMATRKTAVTQAERADRALHVLDGYSKVLSLLVSDNYTDDLNAAVTALGTQIDSGIELYNSKSPGAPIEGIGGIIAAAIRGAGGIWIRHEQSVALRDAVTCGVPLVKEMTGAVEGLVDLWLTGPDKSLIAREREQLRDVYLNSAKMAAARRQFVDLATVERVIDVMQRAEETEDLAKLAKSSAIKYREAHQKLASAVTDAASLPGLLDMIRALKAEVDAARKIHKELSE